LQNKFPDLPLIIDPSHITVIVNDFRGNARSIRFELRWMIIETHIDPDNA
jgi:chorismate mutase